MLLEEFLHLHRDCPAPRGHGCPRRCTRVSGAAPGGGGSVSDSPQSPTTTITRVLIPHTCQLQSRNHSKAHSIQSLTVRSTVRYPEQFPDLVCTPLYILTQLDSKPSFHYSPAKSPSFLWRQTTISIQLSSLNGLFNHILTCHLLLTIFIHTCQ